MSYSGIFELLVFALASSCGLLHCQYHGDFNSLASDFTSRDAIGEYNSNAMVGDGGSEISESDSFYNNDESPEGLQPTTKLSSSTRLGNMKTPLSTAISVSVVVALITGLMALATSGAAVLSYCEDNDEVPLAKGKIQNGDIEKNPVSSQNVFDNSTAATESDDSVDGDDSDNDNDSDKSDETNIITKSDKDFTDQGVNRDTNHDPPANDTENGTHGGGENNPEELKTQKKPESQDTKISSKSSNAPNIDNRPVKSAENEDSTFTTISEEEVEGDGLQNSANQVIHQAQVSSKDKCIIDDVNQKESGAIPNNPGENGDTNSPTNEVIETPVRTSPVTLNESPLYISAAVCRSKSIVSPRRSSLSEPQGKSKSSTRKSKSSMRKRENSIKRNNQSEEPTEDTTNSNLKSDDDAATVVDVPWYQSMKVQPSDTLSITSSTGHASKPKPSPRRINSEESENVIKIQNQESPQSPPKIIESPRKINIDNPELVMKVQSRLLPQPPEVIEEKTSQYDAPKEVKRRSSNSSDSRYEDLDQNHPSFKSRNSEFFYIVYREANKRVDASFHTVVTEVYPIVIGAKFGSNDLLNDIDYAKKTFILPKIGEESKIVNYINFINHMISQIPENPSYKSSTIKSSILRGIGKSDIIIKKYDELGKQMDDMYREHKALRSHLVALRIMMKFYKHLRKQ